MPEDSQVQQEEWARTERAIRLLVKDELDKLLNVKVTMKGATTAVVSMLVVGFVSGLFLAFVLLRVM